jgi:chloride channel 3/4/5
MNPFRTGKLVLFQVTYDRDWHFFEIIFFVVLGIFGVRCENWIGTIGASIKVTDYFAVGSVWSVRDQVQSASRCFSTEASSGPRCCGSGVLGDSHSPHWVLQPIFATGHDVEYGYFVQGVRRWRKCVQLVPVNTFLCVIPEYISHSDFRTEAQWSIANSLLLATMIRIGLVVITYGCKVPAGIFVPSMAIGATFGRMVGILVKAMYR